MFDPAIKASESHLLKFDPVQDAKNNDFKPSSPAAHHLPALEDTPQSFLPPPPIPVQQLSPNLPPSCSPSSLPNTTPQTLPPLLIDRAQYKKNNDKDNVQTKNTHSIIRFQTQNRGAKHVGHFRMLEVEQLEIVRWCIHNVELYRAKRRGQFYSCLRAHLLGTFHRDIKHPGRVLARMIKRRQTRAALQLAQRSNSNFAVVNERPADVQETDLDREIDEWIGISSQPRIDSPTPDTSGGGRGGEEENGKKHSGDGDDDGGTSVIRNPDVVTGISGTSTKIPQTKD